MNPGGNPYKVPGITQKSQEILDYFSEHYSSIKTYVNALRRLCGLTKKYDFTELTYSDYILIKQNITGSVFKLINTFFKFLYCNDYLNDSTGFDSGECFWDKKYWIGYFEKKRINKSKKENDEEEQEEFVASLAFSQIDKLRSFIKNSLEDGTNYENIRMAYCIHAIYFDNMDVNTLREMDMANFNSGEVMTVDGLYKVPPEYWNMFMYYKNRTYSGFSTLNAMIDKLSKIVGINNLIPSQMSIARKQNLWLCSECGNEYLNFLENWQSINGKFVCNGCADKLLETDVKKNLILNEIENVEVDLITEKEHRKIEHYTSNFEKLRNKLKSPCDFDSWTAYLEEIGDLGQKYVVEQEKLKLIEAGLDELSEQVTDDPAADHNNGYDVLSYTLDKKELRIEVKATPGNFDQLFYLTENERQTEEHAWNSGKHYEIHRVYNVQCGTVGRIIYKNFDDFDFDNLVYKISLKNRE